MLDLVERRLLRGLEEIRRRADREKVERELGKGGDRRMLEGRLARPVLRQCGALVIAQGRGHERVDRGAPVRPLDCRRHGRRTDRVTERAAAGAWRDPRVAARGRVLLACDRRVVTAERDDAVRLPARVVRVVGMGRARCACRVRLGRGGVGNGAAARRDAEGAVRTRGHVGHGWIALSLLRRRRGAGRAVGVRQRLRGILARCEDERREHCADGREVAHACGREAHGRIFHQLPRRPSSKT